MEILKRRLNTRKVIAENKVEEVKNEQKEKLNIESPKIKAFLAKIEKISPYTAILVGAFKINTNKGFEDLEFDKKKVAANSFAQKSEPPYYILPRMVLKKIKEDGEDKAELLIYAGIFPNSEKQPKVRTDLKEADIEFIATKNGIVCDFPKRAWLESQHDYLKWLKNFKRRIEKKVVK